MAKIIQYETEAREKLKKGVDTLADAVKVTLVPKVETSLSRKNLAHP